MSHLIATITLLLSLPTDVQVNDVLVGKLVSVQLVDGQQLSGTLDPRSNRDFLVIAIDTGSTTVRYSLERPQIRSISLRPISRQSNDGRTTAEIVHDILFGN